MFTAISSALLALLFNEIFNGRELPIQPTFVWWGDPLTKFPIGNCSAGSRSPYQIFSNCLLYGEASQNWWGEHEQAVQAVLDASEDTWGTSRCPTIRTTTRQRLFPHPLAPAAAQCLTLLHFRSLCRSQKSQMVWQRLGPIGLRLHRAVTALIRPSLRPSNPVPKKCLGPQTFPNFGFFGNRLYK